jgi:hypothetical protein
MYSRLIQLHLGLVLSVDRLVSKKTSSRYHGTGHSVTWLDQLHGTSKVVADSPIKKMTFLAFLQSARGMTSQTALVVIPLL